MVDEQNAKGRDRNFSPWVAWSRQLEQVVDKHPMPESPGDIPAWRARLRGRLSDMLVTFPRYVPPEVEVTDSVDCGTYRRDRLVFDSEANMSIPAFLLVPHARTERGPAVLAVHGHGGGKSDVCGTDDASNLADASKLSEPGAPRGDFAHGLAERGYMVLAPDLRCFGERADLQSDDRDPCDINLVHAYMAGQNPMSQNIHDLTVCLDVLEQEPLVDSARIGVVGFSYGAAAALFLSAWDQRVRTTVLSGYFSSWRAAHQVPGNMCGSDVLPGMLGELEQVDLGALIAPRPLLIETGDADTHYPEAAARNAITALDRVYWVMRAPAGALEHAVFDGGHQWNGVRAYPFLDRWL